MKEEHAQPSATPAARLAAGLAALKRQDWAGAIAQLEPASREGPGANRLRALMGLATAYRHTGHRDKAGAIAQSLAGHDHPQVRAWAEQFLPTLTAAPPSRPAADPTGFVPLGAGSATGSPGYLSPANLPPIASAPPVSPSSNSPAPEPAANALATGFVPLSSGNAPGSQQVLAADGGVLESSRRSPESPGGANLPEADRPVLPGSDDFARQRPTLPSEVVPPPAVSEPAVAWQWAWRNAPGAGQAKRIPQPALWPHRLLQGATVLAVGWLAQQIAFGAVHVYNRCFDALLSILVWIPLFDWLTREATGYTDDPSWGLWFCLGAIALASPWLLDEALKRAAGLVWVKFLSFSAAHPVTGRTLQRQARSLGLPVPYLRTLPTDVPLIFSYGSLPQKMRLVVSQGVVDRLSDEELAALVAGELAAIARWDTALLAGLVTILSLPFVTYVKSVQAVDLWTLPVSRWSARLLLVLSYGLFRAGRWVGLPLARARSQAADRAAAAATGDPNARARALLKLAAATAEVLSQRGQLPWAWEGLDLLLPWSPQEVATLGSLIGQAPIEPFLAWERANPFRSWLSFNSPQPLLGDRLAGLMRLAEQWSLPPELELNDGRDLQLAKAQWPDRPPLVPPSEPGRLWLQSAPYLGAVLGVVFGLLLWIPGGLGVALNQGWGWMYGDPALLWGLALVGGGLGGFARNNRFFPEISLLGLAKQPYATAPLPALLVDPQRLPIDALPVRLEGKLLGRRASANALWQGWWLETASGTLELHLVAPLGWLQILWQQMTSPLEPGRAVVVVGWLRRGARPWLDVEVLAPLERARAARSGVIPGNGLTPDAHPLGSTFLATAAVAIGLYTLYRGL